MIYLPKDCLIFSTPSGEGIPYSAEMISVELLGKNLGPVDSEFLKHAAAAVFHYFREDLERETVTIAEFSQALEKVLRGFKLQITPAASETPSAGVVSSDLRQILAETGRAGELSFFPRLRSELRTQLRQSPQMLCFQGLRHCVKQLAGAQRWCNRCQVLHDQIIEFLRSCMTLDNAEATCPLVVK